MSKEFEKLLRKALVSKLLLLPETEEEVAIAEKAMEKEDPVELPESLRDPYAIWDKSSGGT